MNIVEWFDSEWLLWDPSVLNFEDSWVNWSTARSWMLWHRLVWTILSCNWNMGCKVWNLGINEFVQQFDHLNDEQKADLLNQVLNGNMKLFDGLLGLYLHRKMHIY